MTSTFELRGRFSRFLAKHASVQKYAKYSGRPFKVAELAGHKVSTFDGPWLQEWYWRNDEFLPASYAMLDTLQYVRWYFRDRPNLPPPQSVKLADVCKYFDIPVPHSHDALADAKSAVALMRRLRWHPQPSALYD